MLNTQRDESRRTMLEEVYGFFLAVRFFAKITCELTTLDSLRVLTMAIVNIGRAAWLALLLLTALKFVLDGMYRRVWVWVILAAGFLSSMGGAEKWLRDLTIVLIGLCGMNLDKILRKSYAALLAGVGLIVCLNIFGVIASNDLVRQSGELRHSLGFYHPNTLGSRIFQICAMHLYLKGEDRIGAADVFLCFVAGAFTMLYVNSRTSALLLLLLGVLSAAVGIARSIRRQPGVHISEKMIRLMPPFVCLVPPVAVIAATLLGATHDGSGISDNLWSRIRQSYLYYRYYGLSLGGRALYYHENASSLLNDFGDLYTLDNGYQFCLIGFGVAAFLLLMTGVVLLAVKSALERRWLLLSILAVYALYGFMETSPFKMDYNFFLLLLSELLSARYVLKPDKGREESLEYTFDRS